MSIHKGKPTKDGRCYYFTKYKNGVNHTSQKYLTKKECEDAESVFILKNDSPINKRFDLVANEFFKGLEYHKKKSTINSYLLAYKKHLEPYFKTKYINRINISDIRNWQENMLKTNLKISYLNKIYGILKEIFDYAIKNYNLRNNPAGIYGRFKTKKDQVIDDRKKIRYITLNEFNKFISVIDDDLWRTFFIFAFYTGCRKGEILALTWDDIDFEKNDIYINKTLYTKIKEIITTTSTKNNQNRVIKMSKTLKEELLKYYNIQKKYSDYKSSWYVFGSTTYLPLTTIDRYKHKYFELSEVHEITMHEFRHSHVSLLINEYLKSGQTDTTKFFLMMSNRMGHSIEVMQKTYMHLFPTIQDEIVNLLDNL